MLLTFGPAVKTWSVDMSVSSTASTRQGEVVDAAIRVIARDGLSAASLRSIAREIGYTTGVVMHYFKDKQELLVAAAQAVFDPFDALLAAVAPDGFDGLRRLCVVPLPTTQANEALWRIYAQALASSETEPAFAATVRSRYGAIRARVQALLAEGQHEGYLRNDFDPAAQCDILCALIDGLALHAISEPGRFPPGRLEALVTQELEKLRT
ncbi:HTH-type transcriptional regulator PksA [Mycolicibacterium boenickei]|uniref:HTH-type transcriptional regulator PksA n=2 Tax=Mycolicibacterium boenickei TaxID=146017 RepID=A0ABM7IS83_9MYCO|nr:HTH-type transcriptional regulator PksA [Mycolicibacterium boenickei]